MKATEALWKSVITLLVLIVSFCIARSIVAPEKKSSATIIINDQIPITDLFATLYLGTYGLNYPSSEEILQSCRSNNDTSCLRVYERVKSAARELVVMKSDATLSATFDTIRNSCSSADEIAASFICHGALMSFYFYTELEFDSKILKFIETLPTSTQSEIMNGGLAWFHNRPAPNLWLEYLNSASIDWHYEGSKEQAKAMFSNKSAPPLWATK